MKTVDFVLNLIFPRTCAVCGDAADARFSYALCLGCGNEFEILKSEICPQCLAPQMMCRCRPVYDGGKNVKYCHLIEYKSDFSKKLIFALKKKNNAPLRRYLASELSALVRVGGVKTEIAYAPRSRAAVGEYGFDQSKELARAVSKKLRARFVPLFRHKTGGGEQKELGMTARRDNADESYALKKSVLLREEKLVIVDDVITTGSTVRTLCELASLAGAEDITVLTVAKTGRKF